MPSGPVDRGDLGNDLAVFDQSVSLGLAGMIGQQRTRRMTAAFIRDAEARLSSLLRPDVTAAELEDHTHALVSMAGHLGFLRLSAQCRDAQERARDGGGLECRAALNAAVAEARDAAADLIADDLPRDATAAQAPWTLHGADPS